MEQLISKIENKTANIGIIGLGYVGLPLAMMFSRKFKVIGYDIDRNIIESLCNGVSNVLDVTNMELNKYLNTTFYPTYDVQNIVNCDIFIICLPTPLTSEKEPDLSYVKEASETISAFLKRGQFVILESTTYPGTTEEVVVPILEKCGLKAGIDFGVAYSPERIDPGSNFKTENIPMIVGGINSGSTSIASQLFKSVINADVVQVKDCKTAEATKMFENIFRNVNIALVNEFALICEKMDIDVWNVINAASSKPFGFMSFYPGPGVGGHCIPLDPYYMSYKAKKVGIIPRFIELSGETNDFMKVHVVNLVEKGLSKIGLGLNGSTIAIIGLAYKKDIDDIRETPAKKIIEEIVVANGKVKVYDPFVKSIKTNHSEYYSEASVEDVLCGTDCAVFVIDHTVIKNINLTNAVKCMKNPIIVDCKNLFESAQNENYIYLGIGKISN